MGFSPMSPPRQMEAESDTQPFFSPVFHSLSWGPGGRHLPGLGAQHPADGCRDISGLQPRRRLGPGLRGPTSWPAAWTGHPRDLDSSKGGEGHSSLNVQATEGACWVLNQSRGARCPMCHLHPGRSCLGQGFVPGPHFSSVLRFTGGKLRLFSPLGKPKAREAQGCSQPRTPCPRQPRMLGSV